MIIENGPLVTIGVPTYNRPKGLTRTLNSLVNQTYKNLEIIISDNCSTDPDVEKVLTGFSSDSRIRSIVQPVNKGLTHNFNFVLKEASGGFFMWLADDDWLDLNYIETCLNFLLENSDCAAAYGLAKIHNINEEFVQYDVEIDLDQDYAGDRMMLFLKNISVNGCFSALFRIQYRQELVMKNQIAIDWTIVLRIIFSGKYKMLRTTNSHLSFGGMSSTIEDLTKAMPLFTKAFPYLNVGLNIGTDIIFGSRVYKKWGFYKRCVLAKQCFMIVFKKHKVKSELKPGLKKLIKELRNDIRSSAQKLVRKTST